jgi:prepilin-type N-terminal cleavage/methylation domain-containing protein
MTESGTRVSRSSGEGFSLLEIMIAITVLLVVATIAIPNMTRVVANSHVRSFSGLPDAGREAE